MYIEEFLNHVSRWQPSYEPVDTRYMGNIHIDDAPKFGLHGDEDDVSNNITCTMETLRAKWGI